MSKPDVIGHIVETPAQYDEDGTVTKAATYSESFHVNSLSAVEGADDYLIPTPDSPTRLYAGVAASDTYFYAFPDEAKFKEFVPEQTEEII